MIELFRRLLIRPALCTELVLASLLANVLALATPLFVIQVLNRYVANGVDATLMTLATGALIAVVLEFGFRQVRNKLAKGVSVKPDEQLSLAGFGVLTNAKAGLLERLPPGQQREIMNGIDNIKNAYNANNITAVLDLPFALLFLGVLYLLSTTLGVIVTLFVTLSFLIGLILMAAQRGPNRQLVDHGRQSGVLLGATIQERDTVRAFNAGGFIGRAWNTQIRDAQSIFRRIIGRQGMLASSTQTITALMSISVISAGAILVVQGQLDVGALIGANILAARAMQPISRFAQLGEVFLKAKQSAVMLREFLKLPRELETGSAKREYLGRLEFRDLGFAFPGGSGPLFESLSVTIEPGSICVVTGKNGAGKTTLARLVMGLIDPSRGQILADGLDLRQVLPEWWRRQVIYLPQEPGFLNATIRENLTINNPDIDDQKLNQIIDATGLRSFLDESQAGFETPIVDTGKQLAVGIRRRLAMARALATDGKLIILDEPTEGLDAKGRQEISAIAGEMHKQGKTIIALSHDSNIIRNAQIIIDLNSKPVPKINTVPHAVESDAAPNSQELAT